MSRFASTTPARFATRPCQDTGKDMVKLTRAAVRRALMVEHSQDVLANLPADGESLHAVIRKRVDIAVFLVAMLDRVGPASDVRIATLSFNTRNLEELAGLLDQHEPPRLSLLCALFFEQHNKDLVAEARKVFAERGQKFAAARSHAKVITVALRSGRKLTLEGSANLRSNGNLEQVGIFTDPALHDWHASWIDALVVQHGKEETGL